MLAILFLLACFVGAFASAVWGLWQLVTPPPRCAACREPTPAADLVSGLCWVCARRRPR